MSDYIEAGTLLGGRYEIVERIGSGGMAIVYKAHCRRLNRYVAVKVLRPEFKEDAEFIRKFDVEAQAAASLSHPNIVSIYDVGREGEWHYIVMELVEGITLKQYIEQKGSLPWQEAAGFGAQICSALECAHKNHIIHHDIKPHNIIITPDGVAKVTDFGIARAASSSTMVVGEATIGSVHYFSPEQARGGYTDEKSDIYSAGIVMYEMLTGRVPFNADSPVTIALMHMQNEPTPPREIEPDIPEPMEQIVLKAMRKEQHLRYQTAGEMLADINAVLGHWAPAIKDDGETKVVKPVNGNTVRTRRGNVAEPAKEKKGGKKKKEKTPMSKNDKVAMWLAVVAGVIVLGIVGWFVLSGTGIINPGQWGEVEVPSVVGMDIEAAKESVKDQKFTIEIEEEIASATVKKGEIISQDPAAGRIVKTRKIKVKVSSGAGTVKVPKVVNLEERSAVLELEAAGLVAVITEEESETIPKGVVIRQVPDADVEVNVGDIVRLYVSGTSAEKTKVPGVVGKTLARAKSAIESAGLVVGDIDEVESDQAVGTVIKQSPAGDSSVDKKTKVDLTVSIGAKATQAPTQAPTQPPATQPPATEEPSKVKVLSIPVPQNQESTHIKVVANGKTIHDEVHHKSEGAFDLRVKGTNQAQLQIYHDGVLKSTQTVTFD